MFLIRCAFPFRTCQSGDISSSFLSADHLLCQTGMHHRRRIDIVEFHTQSDFSIWTWSECGCIFFHWSCSHLWLSRHWQLGFLAASKLFQEFLQMPSWGIEPEPYCHLGVHRHSGGSWLFLFLSWAHICCWCKLFELQRNGNQWRYRFVFWVYSNEDNA